MSSNLARGMIDVIRKSNCPDYRQNSHACWLCPHSIAICCGNNNIIRYECNDPKYDKKVYKVKPKKVKRSKNV